METIQWRPEVNPLTTPPSYRIQFVPRGTSGYEEMAADIAATNPNFTEDMIKSLGPLMMSWIQNQLINGRQVTLQDAFSFHISFSGKLDSPDDPLPERDDLLQVNVRVSQPFVKEIRHKCKLERLPMLAKLPVITSTEDTKLKLADVLYWAGVLKMTGSNLDFDESNPNCGCVIAGTWTGATRQTTYASISNSTVLLVPDIPGQNESWKNEYTLTLTTQYSEHGTLRSGTCRRKLRSPLIVTSLSPEQETGILTGGGTATAAYVSIIGGTATANEMLRIQAVIDSRTGQLLLNLLDMQEGGRAGATVAVTTNEEYNLPGFSGSGVSNLIIAVNNYDALLDLTRNGYASRLVDILDIRIA
ncbi:DUF4469 domain-containing protein [Candidatus Electronema sp. PJ]|uniref:DUF4469 domain-containing protein n=1 Tax=Candidatus Electronema sp. PJ TaxID=3401572 RepID=UPI003AA8B364